MLLSIHTDQGSLLRVHTEQQSRTVLLSLHMEHHNLSVMLGNLIRIVIPGMSLIHKPTMLASMQAVIMATVTRVTRATAHIIRVRRSEVSTMVSSQVPLFYRVSQYQVGQGHMFNLHPNPNNLSTFHSNHNMETKGYRSTPAYMRVFTATQILEVGEVMSDWVPWIPVLDIAGKYQDLQTVPGHVVEAPRRLSLFVYWWPAKLL
jgi:hypothetical protein